MHGLIDELTEKFLTLSMSAGVWLAAGQEFHSLLPEAEVYVQIICGRTDELLAGCLSGRICELNDLTDAQDMANSYEAPCTWLETIVQPQVIAPDGLDESSKGNSLGFGPVHLQDLQQTFFW